MSVGDSRNTDNTDFSIPRFIRMALLTRLLIGTGTQLFNPFLPIIAAGLGTNVIVLGQLVSLRSGMGLVVPFFGALADRLSYRLVMWLSLLAGAIGLLLMGIGSGVWVATVGMVMMGIGFYTFNPMLYAYVSARLPYARRAWAIGTIEYSWALAGIFGLFVAGYLISFTNWRVPFLLLGGTLVVAALAFRRLPRATETDYEGALDMLTNWRGWHRHLCAFFDLGENGRSAWGVLTASGLIFFAWMQVMVIYGEWLHAEYGFGAAGLGTVALVLGTADLGGSFLASRLTDRLGKRHSLMLGATGGVLAFGLLPFLNFGVVPVVIGLAMTRTCIEFTIITNISLMTEQAPGQTGKLMSMGRAFASIGFSVGGFSGPWAYTHYGPWGLGPVSALAMAALLAVVILRVREHEPA